MPHVAIGDFTNSSDFSSVITRRSFRLARFVLFLCRIVSGHFGTTFICFLQVAVIMIVVFVVIAGVVVGSLPPPPFPRKKLLIGMGGRRNASRRFLLGRVDGQTVEQPDG